MLTNNQDDFFYAEDDEASPAAESVGKRWKVMIVDDEEEVHEVTRITLQDFTCDDKGLVFIHAYSGAEALELIEKHPDTALILLDVVMETDDAGLQVAKYIREDLKNHFVRIILRTGQAGLAPEKEIVRNYDINDYKEKSELTIQKLYTVVFSSLRSYRDIITIHENKHGLEKIIESSYSLLDLKSAGDLHPNKILTNVLEQIATIIFRGKDEESLAISGFFIDFQPESPILLAGSGDFKQSVGKAVHEVIEPDILDKILSGRNTNRENTYWDNHCAIYFDKQHKSEYLLYFKHYHTINEWERKLIDIFTTNLSIAFDNLNLYNQINNIQKSAIMSLAKLAEYKDTDTGEHIMRVSRLTEKIAMFLYENNMFDEDIDQIFLEQISIASTLHDVGKVGIPEQILLKKGKPSQAEWGVIKQHTVIGGDILDKASETLPEKNYMKMASEIALYHHERFDGSGYPFGLNGYEIPLCARIVSIVDVYDALVSKRPYKEAYSHEKAVKMIIEESGKAFDPKIVVVFLKVISQ